MKAAGVLILVIVLAAFGLFFYTIKSTIPSSTNQVLAEPTPSKKGTMKITSSAFENNTSIPQKYSCDGEGINPPLSFSDVPTNAKSLVLLMDDPDVPKNLKPDGVFDHWVIYNMPPTTTKIAENATPPGKQGLNGAGQPKFTPSCPPDREHRYFFKLYALNEMLNFSKAPNKAEVEDVMKGHILDQAQLIGLYNRQK